MALFDSIFGRQSQVQEALNKRGSLEAAFAVATDLI